MTAFRLPTPWLAALLAAPLCSPLPALAQSDGSAPQADALAPAQQAPAQDPQAGGGGAPAPLVILFEMGSSHIRPQDRQVLDQASRAYSAGKPIVMIVTGAADSVGRPAANLTLSQRRAAAVLQALLDRGIPAERFQVLAKGQTDPAVPAADGVSEPKNRRVEISWR